MDELVICPCDTEQNESVRGDVEGPVCRQWWHHECIGENVDLKNWKNCENCARFTREGGSMRNSGELGLFDNDLEDLHQ